jgi:hypothetical protein
MTQNWPSNGIAGDGVHWPPAPQLLPDGAEGGHATARSPQLHAGTFVEASAAHIPPDALGALAVAPNGALQVESLAFRSVHVPSSSDTVPQCLLFLQFSSNVSTGVPHFTPLGDPHVQVHCAPAVDALVPPVNAASTPVAQVGALFCPSQSSTGPVQPLGTGGAHVVPAPHASGAASKPGLSDGSGASGRL